MTDPRPWFHLQTAEETFLAYLTSGKSIQVAADLAGIGRRRLYRLRRRDPAFRLAWDRAVCEARLGFPIAC